VKDDLAFAFDAWMKLDVGDDQGIPTEKNIAEEPVGFARVEK
jgi:hypothetical protein